MTLRFDNKTIVITGAGRGLGRSYAKMFAARGGRVVVNDPGVSTTGAEATRQPAEDVVAEIEQDGGTAVANFDRIDRDDGAYRLAQQALAWSGSIDVIVNNAGIFQPRHSFTETTPDSFDSLWNVHVLGAANLIRAAWSHMCERGRGRIVNTTSHVALLGTEGMHEYAAAKGAVFGLTRSLAFDGREFGIAVNAVAPAAMTRPMQGLKGLPPVFHTEGFGPDLVAPTVLWLAHEDCRANGEIFGVVAGTTTRFDLTETAGFFSLAATPELLAANVPDIMGSSEEKDWIGPGYGHGTEARVMSLLSRITSNEDLVD